MKTNRLPTSPKSARELLDLYFLDMRSHLIETASALDRIDRAAAKEPGGFTDPRLNKLLEAMDLIRKGKDNRAEKFLQLFSES
jgi:hypothetical protein